LFLSPFHRLYRFIDGTGKLLAAGQFNPLTPITIFLRDQHSAESDPFFLPLSPLDNIFSAGGRDLSGAVKISEKIESEMFLEVKHMNRQEIAALIDHTNLRPDATSAEIRQLCREAREHQLK